MKTLTGLLVLLAALLGLTPTASAQVSDDRDAVVPAEYSRDRYPGGGDASAEVRVAAWPVVRPTVTCYVKLDNKTRRTYFGYESTYSGSVAIPVGFWNWATTSGNEGQPTTFAPGSHDAVFSIDHPKNTTRTWYLDWFAVTTRKAKQCDDSQVPVVPNPIIGSAFAAAFVSGATVLRRRSMETSG